MTLQDFIKHMASKHGEKWATKNINPNDPIYEDRKTMNGN